MRKIFLLLGLFSAIFNSACSTESSREELIRNGDFSKIIPLTDTLLGWSMDKGIGNVSKSEEGMRMQKEFRVLQRMDVAHEVSERYLLNARFKVESGSMTLFIQAFLPETVKRESYWTLLSKSFGPSKEWNNISIELQIPPEKILDLIQVAFSSDSPDTLAYASYISLRPLPPSKTAQNKIFISSADRRVECKSIYVSSPQDDYGNIAAKFLQKHLYNMTGELLPVSCLSEKQPENFEGSILIGKAAIDSNKISNEELKDVGPGGFFVKNKDLVLSIAGKDAPGLVSGISAFLKSIGVKFLSSKEIEYPKIETLPLASVAFKRTPAFAFRSGGGNLNSDFLINSFIASPRKIGGRSGTIHTNGFLVNFDKYHKEHPEYFALQKDGNRLSHKPGDSDDFVHLCMSNPKVQALASENLIKWIELEPQAKYFSIGQGDGYHYRCVCKDCKAMDVEEGNYTDRVLAFVNKVSEKAAEKYPDKIFFMFLYEGSDKMPVKVNPAPHVRMTYCPFRPKWWCHSHAFCKHNSQGMAEISAWFKNFSGQLYVFDYPSGAQEALSIFGSFYAMVEKIRFYSANGVTGLTLCGTPRQFNALFVNVISQLLWYPGIDVEQAIDNFMREYYGPAAPFMREYFDLLYKQFDERQIHQNCEIFNYGVISDDFKNKAYRVFAAAENASKDNPKLLRRVKGEKLFLLYNDLNENNPFTNVNDLNLKDFANNLREFAQIAAEEEIFYVDKNHQNITEWFWRKAGLKLNAKGKWYDEPAIKELIANPLAALKEKKNILQKKIKNGWELPASAFSGGEPARNGSYIVIRRPALLKSIVSADLFLDEAPSNEMELTVTGQEERNCGIEVFVNGKSVYQKSPQVKFYEHPGTRKIAIPKNILKKGKNTFSIKNITSELSVPDRGKALDSCEYQPNPYWGWLIVDNIKITE